MSIFDIVLLLILAGFVFNGLAKGLIRLFGRLVGVIVGAFVASHFYLVFFAWSKHLMNGHDNIGKVASFIIIFVVAAKLTDWAFIAIEKLFDLVSFIPFTKLINRILGGILGLVEGSLFLGLIIFVSSRYAIIGSLFGNQLIASKMAPFLLKVVNIMMPVLPEALKALQSIL
ncbi:MAG: CvpA family protein [Candidatus Falkowbacteria bacterium]|nr:CvpA family protein [Candidatus Falkowbacteria bacterium]